VAQRRRDLVGARADQLELGAQRVGWRGGGRRGLVVQSVLRAVERRRHVEDRAAVLDPGDASRGEALAVAQSVDEVDDGRGEVAGQDEVAVQ